MLILMEHLDDCLVGKIRLSESPTALDKILNVFKFEIYENSSLFSIFFLQNQLVDEISYLVLSKVSRFVRELFESFLLACKS